MTETDNYQLDSLKFKLIVIGDQSTGKSSLINRYLKDTFEENCQSTIGIDFQTKTVNIHDQEVRIIIYDTAGQEKFRSIIPMYIREAQVILFIYDISNKLSFDSIPNWFSEVLNIKNEEAIFILIGNKSDLDYRREVKYEEGEKLANEKNIYFEEVSAKTGKNINELFTSKIYEEIYKKFKHKFNEKKNEENSNYNIYEYTENTINNLKIENNKNNNQKKKKKKCC